MPPRKSIPKFSPSVSQATSEAAIRKTEKPKVTGAAQKKSMFVFSGQSLRRKAMGAPQTTMVRGRRQANQVAIRIRVT